MRFLIEHAACPPFLQSGHLTIHLRHSHEAWSRDSTDRSLLSPVIHHSLSPCQPHVLRPGILNGQRIGPNACTRAARVHERQRPVTAGALKHRRELTCIILALLFGCVFSSRGDASLVGLCMDSSVLSGSERCSRLNSCMDEAN